MEISEPADGIQDLVTQETPASVEQDSQDRDEVGLLDVMESMTILSERLERELGEWTQYTVDMGDVAREAAEEMNTLAQFGSPPPGEVRKIVDTVTESYNRYSDYIEGNSAGLISLMNDMTSAIETRSGLLNDFRLTEEEHMNAVKELDDLSSALNSTLENVSELMNTIQSLPRMTVGFNTARRRVVAGTRPLLDELKRSAEAVSDSLSKVRIIEPNSRLLH
jgi:hypothetical protein